MLHRAMLKVGTRVLALTAEPSLREDQQYFCCPCDDKSIRYYSIPVTTGDLDLVGIDEAESSAPDDVFGCHVSHARPQPSLLGDGMRRRLPDSSETRHQDRPGAIDAVYGDSPRPTLGCDHRDCVLRGMAASFSWSATMGRSICTQCAYN
jgi:hypothetical protein